MVSKLRLRYKHEIMSRERFKKKFTDSYVVVQQRGAEIAALKAKLEKAEREAAKGSELRGRVFELEAEVVARFKEVSKLGVDCEGLRGEIADEARMREEFTSLQDAAAWRFEERATELDARIAEFKRDMDTDLYPHMLTAIAGRR
ncbi:hypothetical protein Tco_0280694 [Tanacetum coccineum]